MVSVVVMSDDKCVLSVFCSPSREQHHARHPQHTGDEEC